MAMIAQGLQIVHVKRGSALVDRNDMVDHLGRDKHAFPHAFLAKRILLKLQGTQGSPLPTLVEVGIVMLESREGFLLREPRTLCVFLDSGHGLSLLNMGPAQLVSELNPNHLDKVFMRESPMEGLVVHIVMPEVRGEEGMAKVLHVLQKGIDIFLIPEHILSVMDIPDVPAVGKSE